MLIRKSEAIEFPFLIAMSLIMHPYTDLTPFLSHSPGFLTPFPRITSPKKEKKAPLLKACSQTSAFEGTHIEMVG